MGKRTGVCRGINLYICSKLNLYFSVVFTPIQYCFLTCYDCTMCLQRSVSRIELMYNACIGGKKS
jgi:hypothetical protein